MKTNGLRCKRIVAMIMSILLIATTVVVGVPSDIKAEIISTIAFVRHGGLTEAAYATWKPVTDATEYRAYVKEADADDSTYVQLDDELLRNYGSYWRVDALGLAAGNYRLKVVAKVGVAEVSNATDSLLVKAHDRSGFAFSTSSPLKGNAPGAYNNDGTLKSNASVVYLTEDNKDKVTLTIGSTTYTGIQAITQAIKSSKHVQPVAIRVIGKVTATSANELSCADMSSAYALGVKEADNVTIEGVGEDATLFGAGVAAFKCNSIEVRNLGLMNWGGGHDGDGITLKESVNVWVHNNDVFYGNAGSDGDQAKGDGSMDLKDNSKFVTISYNHFWDSGKMSLCGMKKESGENWITYHHNWFDHSDSRHPRIRTMSVHVYNNYYDGNSKYGVGAAYKSEAFVEANYFRNCKYPMLISLQGSDAQTEGGGTFSGEAGGVIKAYNNVIEDAKSLVYANSNTGTDPANAVEFDAYLASKRDEEVPSTYSAKQGGKNYSNFDSSGIVDLAVKEDAIDDPNLIPGIVMAKAGRVNGGDFKWTFDNSKDDASSSLNTELKAALNNYKSSLLSVGGGDTTDPTALKGIRVSPAKSTVLVNGTVQLSVSASTSAATVDGRTITYESSDTNIATVSESGLVTAKSLGIVRITATCETFLATATITVSEPIAMTGIVLSEKSGTLTQGECVELSVSKVPVNTTESLGAITWSSSNDAIATVDEEGTVTAIAQGTATIKASYKGFEDTYVLTVNKRVIDTSEKVYTYGCSETYFTVAGKKTTNGASQNINGQNISEQLKLDGSGSVIFTTTASKAKVTVYIMGSQSGSTSLDVLHNIKLTGKPTLDKIELEVSAGTHTLKKLNNDKESWLYYLAVKEIDDTPPVHTHTHTYNSGVVTKQPTCTETGIKTKTCSGCSEGTVGHTTTEVIDAKGHTIVKDAAVAATCTTAGMTAGSHCSVCKTTLVAQNTVSALGHSWDKGQVTKEPTVTEEGLKVYTCATCKATKNEAIPKKEETNKDPDKKPGNQDTNKEPEKQPERTVEEQAKIDNVNNKFLVEEDGALYWYENGKKQGVKKNADGTIDESYRGKEIFDPETNGWYWLDNIDGGKKAVSKDVYQESLAGDWGDIINQDGTRSGKWVRYDAQGKMVKGWSVGTGADAKTINDVSEGAGANVYYFDPIYGTMAKGYATVDGTEYYFNPITGVLERTIATGLKDFTGWKKLGNVEFWYESGARQGVSANQSYRGKEIYDPESNAWYWLDNNASGKKAVSKDVYQESLAGDWGDIVKEDGQRYGKWVRYDENGHMVKGWQTTEDGTYYFDLIYGTMAKGEAVIDGESYFFDPVSGKLQE